MSTLILLLPPQPRLDASAPPASRALPAELDYVLSADGQRVSAQGRAPLDRLPAAGRVLAVTAGTDTAFQRLPVPKAPAARLRAALGSVLEDALLEDEADLHLALAPEARPGDAAWVAVSGRTLLRQRLEALDAAGLDVARVVPLWVPSAQPQGHVFLQQGNAQLAWRDADGVLVVPLAGELARSLLTAGNAADAPAAQWTATPEAAAAASAFVGAPVAAVTDAELALRAAAGDWNLRQFDLQPQRRGVRQLQDIARQLAFEPGWRPVRVGLAVLLVVQLLGLNARAWQERRAIDAKRADIARLVTSTFPNIRALSDPAVQAGFEIDRLRAAAGRPGDADLEALMQAAESAWPQGQAPAAALVFQPGSLAVQATGWSAPEVDAFRSQLRASGVAVQQTGDQLILTRLRGPAALAS